MSLTSISCSMSTCLNKYVTSDATLQNVVKLDMSGDDQSSIADENESSLCDRHDNSDNVSPFLMTVDDEHGDATDTVYLGFVEEAEVNGAGMFDTDRLHHEGDLSIVTEPSELDQRTQSTTSFLESQQIELTSDPAMDTLLDSPQSSQHQFGHFNEDVVRVVSMLDLIQASGNQIYRLVTSSNGTAQLVSLDSRQLQHIAFNQRLDDYTSSVNDNDTSHTGDGAVGKEKNDIIETRKPLPEGCPQWAASLNDCESLGNSYRGWVETEEMLEKVLKDYKRLTSSYWGTRQSPCAAKPSTRLMWRSQYVPFDGIPFINAGSRAIVMECQYGPRRQGTKGIVIQSESHSKRVFKETCPARIYIKRVTKFPHYAVDLEMDKKNLKALMDTSFHALKDKTHQVVGHERYYIRLPTERGHEFHRALHDAFSSADEASVDDNLHRLHPAVAQHIRLLVSSGETKLYNIRNILRHYVEKELFDSQEALPGRHDHMYYPTVNDLQNHIHHALRDIESGLLPLSTINVQTPPSMNSSLKNMSSNSPVKRDNNSQYATVVPVYDIRVNCTPDLIALNSTDTVIAEKIGFPARNVIALNLRKESSKPSSDDTPIKMENNAPIEDLTSNDHSLNYSLSSSSHERDVSDKFQSEVRDFGRDASSSVEREQDNTGFNDTSQERKKCLIDDIIFSEPVSDLSRHHESSEAIIHFDATDKGSVASDRNKAGVKRRVVLLNNVVGGKRPTVTTVCDVGI